MNTIDDYFNQFCKLIRNDKHSESEPFLFLCLKENEKYTIRKLHKENVLFSHKFAKIEFTNVNLKGEYGLLLKMISFSVKELYEAAEFLKLYSKKQILQGVGNYLEKENAWLKYNATWAEKYINASWEHLEVERQKIYTTRLAIHFQTILDLFYTDAHEMEQKDISFNLDTEEKFYNLFDKVTNFNDLNDFVDLHLHFKWQIKQEGNNKLKIFFPKDKKRTILFSELVQSLKNRTIFPAISKYANLRVLIKNLNLINNKDARPGKEFWKYKPRENNELEQKAFMEMMMLDVFADKIFEEEFAIFKYKYFPNQNDLRFVDLNDGSQINLTNALKIFSVLKSLARMRIKKADNEFNHAVDHYSKKIPFSIEAFFIARTYRKERGNTSAIKAALRENSNANFSSEREDIVWKSKNKISDCNCLIQIEYDLIVKMIQWRYQWEKEEIKRIIELFIYDKNDKLNISDAPLFLIDGKLVWIPNSFAFQSASEMLIENLVGKELLTLHHVQTKIFEQALTNLMRVYKFKVPDKSKVKIYKDRIGKALGDLDALAYKDGHLFHFELKLANNKYRYKERNSWKNSKLYKGAKQLKTARGYFEKNEDYVKEILGLDKNDSISHVHSFLISNSFLFDHERFDGFLKISLLELKSLLVGNEEMMYEEDDYLRFKILQILNENSRLIPPTGFKEWAKRKIELDMDKEGYLIRNFVKSHTRPLWPDQYRDPGLLVKYLNENRLFGHLNDIPTVEKEMSLQIGDWTIVRPALILRNIQVISTEEDLS